ncbi:unnamed protein product [Ranitomeya imitator]|uniref:FZ domain-containing protein n=1 Tax=Ranitomeya imitator TaxID=111125 RepID=A0ABN9LSI4_9NEOB|nr:unnamed protein product [Ranitomeya imitator]
MHFHWNVVALLNFGFILWSSAEEYDYYSWQSDNFQNGRFYTKQSKCVDIPQDLHLCHNVGYKKMRLPNLLDHETMPEVKQQASSWVPLLAKRCHRDTQLFLCSLFAPICLERPIYPCRSLCEVVRDSCAPVMESYGFPWPEMLNCNKFPLDNDLCITVQYGTKQVTQPSADFALVCVHSSLPTPTLSFPFVSGFLDTQLGFGSDLILPLTSGISASDWY